MKKMISILLVACMTMGIAACGSTGGNTSGGASSQAAPAAEASSTDAAASTEASSTDAASTEASDAEKAGVTEDTIVLQFGCDTATVNGKSMETDWMYYFNDCLIEESNGKYALDIYTDGQLGGSMDLLDMTKQGSMKITKAAWAQLSNMHEIFGVAEMPYMWKDVDHLRAFANSDVLDEIFSIANLEENHNLHPLLIGYFTWLPVATKAPVRTVEDVKGMKIRTVESVYQVDGYNAVGALGTPMAWGEVYTNLQQGVIDGVQTVAYTIYTAGIYDVCSHLNQLYETGYPQGMVVNNDWWQSLSDEDKGYFERAAQRAMDYGIEHIIEEEAWATEELKNNHGMEIVYIDEIDREGFREAAQSVYDKYDDKFGDIIEKINALAE